MKDRKTKCEEWTDREGRRHTQERCKEGGETRSYLPQHLYGIFCEIVGGNCPGWDELPELARAGWVAVAQEVRRREGNGKSSDPGEGKVAYRHHLHTRPRVDRALINAERGVRIVRSLALLAKSLAK